MSVSSDCWYFVCFRVRRTLLQSAVLQSHVVRACVRPSVCDIRGSGPHRLPLKMSGKLDGHSYPGTHKNLHTTHIGYRVHRTVIFAIAWHLVNFWTPHFSVWTLHFG